MFWFIFVSVYCVLSHSPDLVVGQSTVSSCAVSVVESDESLQRRLEEYDHRLEAVESNKSLQRRLEEYDHRLETVNQNIRSLSSAMDEIKIQLNNILDRVIENHQAISILDRCPSNSVVCDCSDIKANGYTANGVYRIYVVNDGKQYYANASCDMTTTDGAWTVFQRRKDGSVDFYREWSDYANGFGNPNEEFWLGNNFLHLLTSKRRYRLRIDLEDFEGEKRYAEYSTFNISSSADKYRLSLETYSGTAGNSLNANNGHRFSTKDSDNDLDSGNCAAFCRGAWWYKQCTYSNLNGLYQRGSYTSNGSFNGWEGIMWYDWRGYYYSLKTSEMKISSS